MKILKQSPQVLQMIPFIPHKKSIDQLQASAFLLPGNNRAKSKRKIFTIIWNINQEFTQKIQKEDK